MFIFRILDFVFRLFATVMLVLILQISFGGRTLEDYLMSFIQTSNSLAPVRDVAYSGVRKINPDIQIKETNKRTPASIASSGGLKKDLLGEILKTVLLQYTDMIKDIMKSKEGAERYPEDIEKEIDKVAKDTQKPSSSAKEKTSNP